MLFLIWRRCSVCRGIGWRIRQGCQCRAVAGLRDNPLTQGFYAPVQVVVLHSKGVVDVDGEGEGKFVLGEQDVERDGRYCGRLDMDTMVRRRLYKTIVRKRCRRMRRLDGLPLKKEGVHSKGGGVWCELPWRRRALSRRGIWMGGRWGREAGGWREEWAVACRGQLCLMCYCGCDRGLFQCQGVFCARFILRLRALGKAQET